jgi:hypothetical protein
MEWLLNQGEFLPVILASMIASIAIGRFIFGSKSDLSSLQAQIRDLRAADGHHMASITRAHGRIDECWMAVHRDMVHLFEMMESRRDDEG